jgi:hypothetical protein
MKSPPCTLSGAKHKWVYVRDIEIRNITMSARGTLVRISVRGEYKCACGKARHGQSKGGIQI